jgi:ribosomal protein L25 (general stress protein Ctc)
MNGIEGRLEVLEDNSSKVIRHANAMQRAIYGFGEEAKSASPENEQLAAALNEINHHIRSLLTIISGSITVLRDTTEEIL